MEVGRQIRLTSSEIAQLWTQYMNDSGSICILSYFLEKVEDAEIEPIIGYSLELSKGHIQRITGILTEERNAIPNGFRLENDVDITSAKLYSDSYVLNYIQQMAQIGLQAYSTSVASSVRADITEYYMGCLTETMHLYMMSKDLLLSKGLYVRSPYIPNLIHVDYVKKQRFIFDAIGETRPLTALEIANLYSNIQRNILGMATLVGFSQVAHDKAVKQFFLRGIEIAKKHIKIFGSKLDEGNLPVPMSLASDITNMNSHVFSDKIMMFYTSGLIALSVGYYGIGIAQSPRLDLGVMYNRLSLEIQLYSEDGANLMIKNKWLEQPPMASDRDELVKKKK